MIRCMVACRFKWTRGENDVPQEGPSRNEGYGGVRQRAFGTWALPVSARPVVVSYLGSIPRPLLR